MSCDTKIGRYNKFLNIRSATKDIVNYLFENAPDFWKLLYYRDKTALQQPELTSEQKSAMICKNPEVEDTSEFNILFQTNTDEGLSVATNQVRIELGEIYPLDPHRGAIEINFQIVVPNKMKLIISEYSDVDDRSVAIFQTIADALNGTQLECFSSPMFMDRAGDGGRRNGAQRERANKNYSGYWVTYTALC